MNPRISTVPPSLIRAIHARKRPGDLDLGLGEPTLRPDPAPFEAAVEWVRGHGCPYSPNAGLPELRERIAAYLAPPALSPEGVCVTVGSEEALYLAIKALVDPGRDEVLIVEPCYLAYPKICMLEGIRHRMVAMSADDGFGPRAERVLEALRPETRMVVINSPANPTGRVWPVAELEALARGLEGRERPVYVLSDEVYRELYYTPERPRSIAEWHPRTLVAGSLSKSNALTGLRLGWLAGPAEAIRGAVTVHQFVNTAADTFAQRVALEVFAEPGRLRAHRSRYAETRPVVLDAARRWGIEVIEPEGAFYAMVRLPPPLSGDSVAAAEQLLERERVVTVPGAAFGESAEGWLRLSWVASADVLEEGVRRIGRWLAAAG